MKIAVIGGGISGLSAAYYLKKFLSEEVEVTLFEKSNRVGGWIRTEYENGYLFEKGPRSLRTYGSGENTLELVRELGLENEVLLGNENAHSRFLYLDQTLKKIPQNLFDFFRSPWIWKAFPALFKEWITPGSNQEDETIDHFARRRLNHFIAESLINPMAIGIYAGNSSELSIHSCFPSLVELERMHGSLLKGMLKKKKKRNEDPYLQKMQASSLFTFEKGMETLVSRLEKELGGIVQKNYPIKTLDQVEADAIIFALPSYQMASFFPAESPLANHLRSIPYTNVTVVNIGYDSDVLPCNGFGYLVPSKEKSDILGVVWDSSAFPNQNLKNKETRLTVMLGGEVRKDFHELDKEQIIALALKEIEKQMGVKNTPVTIRCEKLTAAIPQYFLGHKKNILNIEKELSAISSRYFLAGNAFYGVSVNDCIKHSKSLAMNIKKQFSDICKNKRESIQ